MQHQSTPFGHAAALALTGTLTIAAGICNAQTRGCQSSAPASLGAAVGRSSPYFDLEPEAVDASLRQSIFVRGGRHISVRGDVSLAGPLRARVEGWLASWSVEGRTYDPDQNFQLVATTSLGHVAARHIGAAVGLRLGRPPACAHVLVGGGLYSLAFRGASLRRPGLSITAGIEIPTGARGRVQVDVQVHVIDTNGRFPVSSTKALAGALVGGWAINF